MKLVEFKGFYGQIVLIQILEEETWHSICWCRFLKVEICHQPLESLDWVKVGLGLVGWLGWSGLLDNPNKDQVSKYTSLTQKKKKKKSQYSLFKK